MTSNAMKKVLYVGFTCVDCVNVIDKFPEEDADQQILNYYWQRGGNASNSSTVTSLLSIPCEYFGVMPTTGPEASWMIKDLQEAGICTDHCVEEPVQCIVSTNIINVTNGTRTILFCLRDYRLLTAADLNKKFGQDFSAYSWVHFELTPNHEDVLAMVKHIYAYNERCRAEGKVPVILSVEVESANYTNAGPSLVDQLKSELPDRMTRRDRDCGGKTDSESLRSKADVLMKLADIVFMSKDFAKSRGFSVAVEAVENLYHLCRPGATLICAWGEKGAALHRNGMSFHAPAKTDMKVVDSLGAGDTFNAGFISYAVKTKRIHDLTDNDLRSALTFACQLAGHKCSIFGYSGLKSYPLEVNY